MSKRLPANLSEEELLAHLENAKSSDTIEIQGNDIPLFISVYDIQPGDQLVKNVLLYQLYKTWSKDPESQMKFIREMKLYLEMSGPFLKINQNALKLSKMAQDAIFKEKRVKTSSPHMKEHIEAFMKHYGVEKGTFWIEAEILFDLYDEWCYSNKRSTQLNVKTLISFLKLYLNNKKLANDSIVFSVDKSITKHISNERIENIRRSRKTRNAKKAPKTKKSQDTQKS